MYGYWGYLIFICSVNNSKNKVMKKDLFSQNFNGPVTLPGFFNTHSVAGIQRVEKDDPPVVVIPPAK